MKVDDFYYSTNRNLWDIASPRVYVHGIRANRTDIILHIPNTVAPKDL